MGEEEGNTLAKPYVVLYNFKQCVAFVGQTKSSFIRLREKKTESTEWYFLCCNVE